MGKNILLLLLAVIFVFGCSDMGAPTLPDGRCDVNDDCDQGKRCEDTWCEDIYHPEIGPTY